MNVGKKRKIDSECRVLQNKWTNQNVIVIENKKKIMFIACREIISIF